MANQFGMQCPACGDEDAIDVAATVWVRLLADGTDADAAHEQSVTWQAGADCRCDACGWTGTAGQATPEPQRQENGS